MATLNDTGAWPVGIYQIEQTDPVLGGVPNEATGAGMSNIPHLQLARRTRITQELINASGLGASVAPLVELNGTQARINGTYRYEFDDPASPAGSPGVVLVASGWATAVTQIAMESITSRMWNRFWNGTVWSPWKLIWGSVGTTQILAPSGWQRLPSGALRQWGSGVTGADGRALITFPTAFTTNTYIPMAIHAGSGPATVIEDGSVPKTTTQVTFRVWNPSSVVMAGVTVRWGADGW